LEDNRSKKGDIISFNQVNTPFLPSPLKGEGLGRGEKRKFLYNQVRMEIDTSCKLIASAFMEIIKMR